MSDVTTLITGASSDIGIALLASLLVSEPDVRFLAHCHTGEERLKSVARDFPARRIDIVGCDLGDRTAVQALLNKISGETISRFVHLPAQKFVYNRLSQFDYSALEKDLYIQVGSAAEIARAILPGMTRRAKEEGPFGRVVFVLSSVVLGVPPKFSSQYTIVKHAQLGLMRALASDCLGQRTTVNAVSPAMVETRFLSAIPAKAIELAAAQNPTGRNARVDDVVRAIQFFLDDAAGFVTGVNLPVTGGVAF